MKNISILFLILFILFGCNNINETLSKIKNKNPNNKNLDTVNEQEIEKYKYQDICELFFEDSKAILHQISKGEVFYISIDISDNIMSEGYFYFPAIWSAKRINTLAHNFDNDLYYEEDYSYEDEEDYYYDDVEDYSYEDEEDYTYEDTEELATNYSYKNILSESISNYLDNRGSLAIFLIHTKGTKAAEISLISLLNEEFSNRYISERNRRICIMRDNEVDTYVQKNKFKPVPPPPEVIEIVEDKVEIEDEIEIEDTESNEDEMIEIEDEYDDEFFMVVENMPEFPVGDLGLMKYIQKNVKYPPISKQYNITGKVYVSFIVEKSGYVSNVKIVRGVDKNLDAEAVRVVNSLPKYKPGKQRGKPARVMFTIPINFTLN